MIQSNKQDGYVALYCRLSSDDGRDGESNSITNQKIMLERYAQEKGFGETRTYIDDGFSGTNFQRPGFISMKDDIDKGIIHTVIVRDLSRFGRDYINVGYFVDSYFPDNDVRFIAINDFVDTKDGENDFMPYKNISNEQFAKDTSRKVRMAHRLRGNNGHPLAKPPFGYKKNPSSKTSWLVDEVASEVVKRIFKMTIDGFGTEQIAGMLEREKVLTPNHYAKENGYKVSGRLSDNKYRWRSSTVSKVLALREYCGDIVNFKTYSKSYKNKKRRVNPAENRVVFEGVNKPIIDRATFEKVQKTRGKIYNSKRKEKEHHMFSGLLVCSDCGSNLHFHFNQGNKSIQYFSCSKNNNRNRECPTTHYVRTDFLEEVVRRDLNRVIEFSEQYKDEFLKILLDNTGAEMERQSNYLEGQIEKLTKRNTELDRLFNSVYEDKVSGMVSEERFKRMTQGFEAEQNDNIIEIDRCKMLLNARTVEIDTAKAFLDIIEKTTCIEKLTAPVLREFVDKIIIHHRQRVDGEEVQKIEIFYNVIGKFIIPVHLYALDEVVMDTRQGVHVVALTA